MTEYPEGIQRMLSDRRLDRVEANPDHARAVVTMAEQHLRTAAILIGTEDIAMAFTAAYDGARKALTAVLAVEGLRVRPVGGAHRNTGMAVALLLPGGAEGIAEFEWMRQVRNSTEYPDGKHPAATRQDVGEAISAGDTIVQLCTTYVRARTG